MHLKSYFKITLIGDAGVGKTQLWHAFNNIFKNDNEKTAFNEEYHQTFGFDFDPHEHVLENGED